jgi:hypothetical protein
MMLRRFLHIVGLIVCGLFIVPESAICKALPQA